jgi:hypothetical protein
MLFRIARSTRVRPFANGRWWKEEEQREDGDGVDPVVNRPRAGPEVIDRAVTV